MYSLLKNDVVNVITPFFYVFIVSRTLDKVLLNRLTISKLDLCNKELFIKNNEAIISAGAWSNQNKPDWLYDRLDLGRTEIIIS